MNIVIRTMARAVWGLALAALTASAARSAVTSVKVISSEAIGDFGGVAFRRVRGVIHGTVGMSERVAGLSLVSTGRDDFPYETSFEIISPVDARQADSVIVEAPNRGVAIFLAMMDGGGAGKAPNSISPEDGETGDGFLLAQHFAIANVQWQTSMAKGVPSQAQGVGEVIIRDFGLWLAGKSGIDRVGLPVFRHRILTGISQSAWLVNSVVAEGFNVDPESGKSVYQGIFTRNGNGVVLAINGFAGDAPQRPYIAARPPLTPHQLFSRPQSDPVAVDVASLTDFYRVRASVFATAPTVPGLHRYASAAAHAPGALMPSKIVFGTMHCNDGVIIPLSPISDALYLRPLLLGLAAAIGADVATPEPLPKDAPLVLTEPPHTLKGMNLLPGADIEVPRTDGNGSPLGGIPLLEAAFPIGVVDPPALSPVDTTSITETCGNFAGWRPFSADELTRRYGSRDQYNHLLRRHAAQVVTAGYLLPQDKFRAVDEASALLPADFR